MPGGKKYSLEIKVGDNGGMGLSQMSLNLNQKINLIERGITIGMNRHDRFFTCATANRPPILLPVTAVNPVHLPHQRVEHVFATAFVRVL